MNRSILLLCLLLLSAVTVTQAAPTIEENPQIAFAFNELQSAAPNRNYTLKLSIDECLAGESYKITSTKDQIEVVGGDYNGVMYAILEIAERERFGVDLSNLNIFEEPYMGKRGIKLNMPLDGRTPSYDDTGDAAQQNILVMWEWEYWQALLDDMARNRYNLLTLWSLHPFPSMVRVPEYPDVALDDVCQYTGKIDAQTDMKWIGEDLDNPDKQRVIKKITMDEKMEFWHRVFTYAQDRGVEVHLYTWNIFVYGTNGKYGITWDQTNPITADYIRKSTKAFLEAYPMVKGIGVTAGEHADRKITGRYGTESWMWESYGQGIMDAKYNNPQLDVRFIFRQHWSDWSVIDDAFRYYDGPLESSFKYSRARMFSSTTPPWFDNIFRGQVEEYGINCWFNIRNDDLMLYRWGDPEYANEYMQNMPRDVTPGYFVGSDGYLWGRTYCSRDEALQGGFEFRRQWYSFMIWGRAGYNPTLTSDHYKMVLKDRFPKCNSELLYQTWRATSQVVEWVNKIHFRQNDRMFSPETCMSDLKFSDLERFIAIGSMPEQGVISIADYALGYQVEGSTITPFEVCDKLESGAKTLLDGSRKIKVNNDPELRESTIDMRAMAYLAQYYADKVRAATHLATYRAQGGDEQKSMAIKFAERALKRWKLYAATFDEAYTPMLLARVNRFDPNWITQFVEADIEIARNADRSTPVERPDDNYLWKKVLNRI